MSLRERAFSQLCQIGTIFAFGILISTLAVFMPIPYGNPMSLVVEQMEPVPLTHGSDGAIRVAGTRVTLDTVAYAFEQGATPEEIAQQYPSLPLADIYFVLGYVLRHQNPVRDYLRERAARSLAIRQENEHLFDPTGLRSRLLARRKQSSSRC